MIKIGNLNISGMYVGTVPVKKVCIGSIQIYPADTSSTMIYHMYMGQPGLSDSVLSNFFTDSSTFTQTSLGNDTYRVVYDGSLGAIKNNNASLTNLEWIEIHGTITGINAYAFHDLTHLEHFSVEGISGSIGTQAFYNDDALTRVDLGTVTNGSIAAHAFGECSALESFDITGMRAIDYNAFTASFNLKRLYCNDAAPLFMGLNIKYPLDGLIIVPDRSGYANEWPDHAFQIAEDGFGYYIDMTSCAGCGSCELACADAISYMDDVWVIDQSKCNQCGSCVSYCGFGAILEL